MAVKNIQAPALHTQPQAWKREFGVQRVHRSNIGPIPHQGKALASCQCSQGNAPVLTAPLFAIHDLLPCF